MLNERNGIIKFGEQDVTVIGDDLMVGQKAPEFHVHTNDWLLIPALENTKGKIRVIGSLLSLNTGVCDRETRRFNQEATSLGENVVVMFVSMDLPFTQKSWCGAAGVDHVISVSDHMNSEFGEKYGVLIKELRILRRAIFVVDRSDRIVYADYMPALGDEPDYNKVIQAVKQALAKN